MFKTIFGRLISIFILILFIGFSITGVMLYYFLSDFVLDEKIELLEQSGEFSNQFLKIYLENQNNALIKLGFEQTLETLSANTNSIIWIVNYEGTIGFIEFGPFKNTEFAASIKNKLIYGRLPDERQYKEVMNGNKSFVEERGDLYGLFKDTQVPWLTIQKPFKYIGEDNVEKVGGAVYFSTPIPEVQRVRTTVLRFFGLSVLAAIAVSVILVYVFSLRISRPLKQIKNAARLIAGGEFQKRLDIKSQDEIGELAQSFNQMAVALENLEEMRRGFIANVSHELRTPMTSIRGFIEGILDGVIPPDRQPDYLKIVRDEISRLNRLVNDLLDLAKMESGEVVLNLSDFNLNELIRRCIIKLEAIIEQKRILVEASFEEEDMYVNADADAIERVVINLVHNAIKFTGKEGKINISTYWQKGKAFIVIADNGIGIDSSEIGMIWDRFYKSDKSRGKDKSGTGLGLAIVKNILNEHNQQIRVESEISKGTSFIFTLNAAEGK